MNHNEYKVLGLMEREGKPLFFREISKKSGVSIGGTQKILKDYSDFIEKETRGRNTYYYFKKELKTMYLKKKIEMQRAMDFLKKNPWFERFIEQVADLRIDFLVFGSYSKLENKTNKKGDLDLLVLTNKDNVKIPEHLSPKEVHVIKMKPSSFEKSLGSGEYLTKEILKNHVIFRGFDFFTEVFNKYGKN